MPGGFMVIKPGEMRKLHRNPNANKWRYYLRGSGQVAVFGSGARGEVAEGQPDQPAFNRKRLKAEKLTDSKVLEQLIRVQEGRGLL
jgi:oxalate decarboxylase/phosphoglucose isomerase-like protein (cupin superfamily)